MQCSEESEQHKPQKKALLIGIQYESKEDSEVGDGDKGGIPLKGPHSDIMGMRELLIGSATFLLSTFVSSGLSVVTDRYVLVQAGGHHCLDGLFWSVPADATNPREHL